MVTRKKRAKNKTNKTFAKLLFYAMGKALIINAVIVAISFSLFQFYRYCTTSSSFVVNNISVSGNSSLPSEEILALSGDLLGGNIFLTDLKKIHNSILAHPRIKTVFIEKEYPSTIVIEIEERTPFVVLNYLDTDYLLDQEGVILSREDKMDRFFPRLIGIPGVNHLKNGDQIDKKNLVVVSEMITVLDKFDFELPYTINIEKVQLPMLIMGDTRKEITFFAGRLEEGIRNYKFLQRRAREKLDMVKTVNMSFKNKAVIEFLPGL